MEACSSLKPSLSHLDHTRSLSFSSRGDRFSPEPSLVFPGAEPSTRCSSPSAPCGRCWDFNLHFSSMADDSRVSPALQAHRWLNSPTGYFRTSDSVFCPNSFLLIFFVVSDTSPTTRPHLQSKHRSRPRCPPLRPHPVIGMQPTEISELSSPESAPRCV